MVLFCPELNSSSTNIDIADTQFTNTNVAITSFISSVTYLVMNSFVIDLINVRKKSQVQIITNDEELAKILISNFRMVRQQLKVLVCIHKVKNLLFI